MAAAVAAAAAGSSSVEFIRARSDKREYRRVVLANALEILLISDPDTDKVRRRSPALLLSRGPRRRDSEECSWAEGLPII